MRRLGLILLALLLVLGSGAAELQALMPQVAASCCCGDEPSPEPCPCGPARCPGTPRTPTPASHATQAAPVSRTQASPCLPRTEARPWTGLPVGTIPSPLAASRLTHRPHAPPAPASGPPPGPYLAQICTLRS